MGNNVFRHNGFTNTVTTNNHITAAGSDWYWTVCAVMTVSTLAFMALSFFKQRSQRLLYYIAAGLTLIPAISYFCMGSNLGWTAILVEWVRSDPEVHGDMRQIFYVRYIDYFITVPLLLTMLLLSCGLPTSTLLYTLLMGEVWVIMALVGALVHSEYKWGFFTFGTVALLFVCFALIYEGRAYARTLGQDILRVYTVCSAWVVSLWIVYPIIWGVSEGGNVIPPDSEAVAYGVLDILIKPLTAAVLIWGMRNVEMERLGIHIRDVNAAPGTAPQTEKSAEAAAAGEGVTAPAPADTTATSAV
ncbi:uncharacterized protein A1O5_06299 [Cladophialophora psammophila CBS 110553]|uniref:Rhodopsin n=1 Tax=Cladophialophora psammophila CBS 110553 TaxID=1182543 RepID=W9WZX9_9EURO|nr:uncharacterized protein A1O5_06299 [Cladophialophora psammophila CBS 110553]EXJ70231.1 hypothetical protein A1O5_06299 [Cladophialophora psammophila CBS 110553]